MNIGKSKSATDASRSTTHNGFYAWIVWGIAAAFFFTDYLARVSPGVMVPELMDAFQVTALGLGSLSAFFYYPYVVMQIPVGLLVDRFGVRRLLVVMALVTCVACAVFGSATNVHVAELGRFLLGFGSAFAFVSALKLAAVWFPPSKLGLLAGLTQALGMLGAAMGEAPVSFMVSTTGWRNTMFAMSGMFVIIMILIAVFIRDYPKHSRQVFRDSAKSNKALRSLKLVLSNPQSWLNAVYVGFLFAPTAAFAELWGVSYLKTVQGMGVHSAAAAVGLIFIGFGVGGPIVGWLSDRLEKRKPVMIASVFFSCVFMSTILFVPNLPSALIYILLFLYGVSNTGVAIAYAFAAEINPHRIAGASLAFANMASIMVGALLQPVIGWLLDFHNAKQIGTQPPTYTAGNFEFAMLILPAFLLLGLIAAFFLRETHCRGVHR